MSALGQAEVARYLRRLGISPEAVWPIQLDVEAFSAKILHAGRGGFCYELNGLFAALLATLGYSVTLLEGRVTGGTDDGPLADLTGVALDPGDVDQLWAAGAGPKA